MKTLSTLLFLGLFFCGFSQSSYYNQMVVGANNNGAIFSAELNGNSPTEIITGQAYQSFYRGVFNSTDGKVYMAWYYGIYSMDLDGSNFTQLYDYQPGGMGNGIALDETNGHIYFTQTPVDSIYRMNLDGSNLTGIYGGVNVDYLSDIQLDIPNGHIYYAEWIAGSGIHRIDLNGTNYTSILPGLEVRALKTDLVNGKHYYTNNGDLFRCNLDGTNPLPVITGQGISGIDIDLSTNTIYYTSFNNIVFSTDMNGNNYQVLVQATDIYFNGVDPMEAPHGPVLVYNPALCTIDISVIQNGPLLTANASGLQYQWLDCDNGYAEIPGETSASFTATTGGNYAVEITDGPCVDTSMCLTVTFADLAENETALSVSLYPNPTNGTVNIRLGDVSDEVNVKVINATGVLTYHDTFKNTDHIAFDIDAPAGVYFVELTLDQGMSRYYRLIKK